MEAGEQEKWVALLKSVDFFKPFTNEELLEMLKYGQVKKFTPHEYIIEEDSVDYSFFVLLRGKVNVIKSDAHKRRKVRIAQLDTGACFGEMAMLLDGRRSASIMAHHECYVFIVHAKEVEFMPMETQLTFIKRVAIQMAKKMQAQTESLIDLM